VQLADVNLQSSREAEDGVLAAVLYNSIPEEQYSRIDKASAWIQTPKAFYYKKTREIWQTIIAMQKDKIPIDPITLLERMNDTGRGDNDLKYYLIDLQCPSGEMIGHYARIVRERYIQREIKQSALKLVQSTEGNHEAIQDVLAQHHKLIQESQSFSPDRTQSIQQIATSAKKLILEGGNVIPFGMAALDASAGGGTRGEVSVWAGRPGHGKTTLMVNATANLIRQGYKVLFFNREMTNPEMVKKFFVLEAQGALSYERVRMGNLLEHELPALDRAETIFNEKYKDNLIMVDDVREIDETMRIIRRVNADVVISDYVQVEKSGDGKKEKRHELDDIMQEYKWTAKETNSHIMIVSQLNRELERRIDPIPRLSDLAEAGTIEQIAEFVGFVFYGYNFDSDIYEENASQIIVGKARYGKVGRYTIGYNGDKCAFYGTPKEALANGAGQTTLLT
jgi:replicative DNA helicase